MIGFFWSGQQDSNLRPAVPKTAALPGCAIPRGTGGGCWIHVSPAASKATQPPPLSTSKSTALGRHFWHYFLNMAPATLSPGAIPSLRAVPPITSSTARTGPPEGTRRSESGSVFSAMRRMLPSARMKIMSSGM